MIHLLRRQWREGDQSKQMDGLSQDQQSRSGMSGKDLAGQESLGYSWGALAVKGLGTGWARLGGPGTPGRSCGRSQGRGHTGDSHLRENRLCVAWGHQRPGFQGEAAVGKGGLTI